MRRALFLDRDGVINVDHGYISGPDQFDVIDGVFDALRQAQKLGYLLVVITNQSGIARGYFTDDDYQRTEDHMRAIFLAEGIRLDAIYHCPHHPDGVIPALAVSCDCRKPEPGMILRAARDHDIDLAASIMVGDKDSDIAAAGAAGVGRSYLVAPPRFTLKDVNFD
jgi:D-glycero-D-manno-heptose 1,7-bisphosphate phosphatase